MGFPISISPGESRSCAGSGGLPRRVIVCHLGSGASVCALLDGVSVDTSMGMTPLEGLVMATRCGDIDPGLILYLLRERKIASDDLDDLLNHKSGLAGLAEGSGGERARLEDRRGAGSEAEIRSAEFRLQRAQVYRRVCGGARRFGRACVYRRHRRRLGGHPRACLRQSLEFLGFGSTTSVNHARFRARGCKISVDGRCRCLGHSH